MSLAAFWAYIMLAAQLYTAYECRSGIHMPPAAQVNPAAQQSVPMQDIKGKNLTTAKAVANSMAWSRQGAAKSPQRTRAQATDDDDDDDDEFSFLVSGGYRPPVNEFAKYLASIRSAKQKKFFGDNHFCGGTIISDHLILTAAHCVVSGARKRMASQILVVVGTPRRLEKTSDSQLLRVAAVIPHARYKPHIHDIALLRLKKPISIDNATTAIMPLPLEAPEAQAKCVVVGWGKIIFQGPSPNELVNADLSVHSQQVCGTEAKAEKGMICASNLADYTIDSCQGDSGGPLICDSAVAGIVSFGRGCGEGTPGYYTNVYNYVKWIKENAVSRTHINNQPLFLLLLVHIYLVLF